MSKKYPYVTDHSYAMRDHDGDPKNDSGYVSKHTSESAAKNAATTMKKVSGDGNYYHRPAVKGEHAYKEHELPHWKKD